MAHDSSGTCIGWMSQRFAKFVPPLIVEAFAAREAISLTLRAGWEKVILEGDCESLFHLLRTNVDDNSASGPVVNEIRFLCSRISCAFSIVKRTGNCVAHILLDSQVCEWKAHLHHRLFL
ncbi:hypothetical protein Salat_1653900 [Sesamum alatum]|uniref:RNase H type-1 domain-containing protein n=1 Tax=Sesamum alatum TaxID=300844 RepID=A0AAE1Y7N6_9LAMI|nr:hypothetical protein Salat_1653900 [Sesamum alatum]